MLLGIRILHILTIKKMTISYFEWRTKQIKEMTENTYTQIEFLRSLGIKGEKVLLLALQVAIEDMLSKENLIWFLNNQDKIE
jgi:p-aminobenzoyl-glutamate transporter AbgT